MLGRQTRLIKVEGSTARAGSQRKSPQPIQAMVNFQEQNQRETEVIACSAGTESTVTFIKTGASWYIIIKEGGGVGCCY